MIKVEVPSGRSNVTIQGIRRVTGKSIIIAKYIGYSVLQLSVNTKVFHLFFRACQNEKGKWEKRFRVNVKT